MSDQLYWIILPCDIVLQYHGNYLGTDGTEFDVEITFLNFNC